MKKFVLISGGKDSTATLLKVLEKDKNIEGIFCDTGWEHPYTYKYIKELEKFTKVKIHLIKNKDYQMVDIIEKYLPNDRYRTCTTYLKELPTRKFLRQFKPKEILLYSGVRKEESSARSKRYKGLDENSVVISSYSIKKQKIYEQYPIIDWNVEEVKAYIKKKGFYLNPLYDLGFDRVGCFPCICSSVEDIKKCYLIPEGKENILKIYEKIKTQRNRLDKEAKNYQKIIDIIELNTLTRIYDRYKRI